MIPITTAEIAKNINGTLVGSGDVVVDNVCIDSRECGESSLFVALVGENTDAHKFIANVINGGTRAILSSKKDEKYDGNADIIYVDDTLKALQALGTYYRSKVKVPVIGITGSVGKTTTKEMVATVLEAKYKVLKTKGNWNSQIGVARMMLEFEEDTEIAVIEMGMSEPGEMGRLVDISRPDVAIITNIGDSHIGNLGSREKIAFEKGHIIKYAHDSVYMFAGGDMRKMMENLPEEYVDVPENMIYYGTEEGGEDGADIYADNIISDDEGVCFTYNGNEAFDVRINLHGMHNVANAVIALAIGEKYGVSPEDAAKALAEYKPFSMRGEMINAGKLHIVDDTYNASPDSIRSNLSALFEYEKSAPKVAVLGDVLELGEFSEDLHRGVGEFIVKEYNKGNKLSMLITLGKETKYIKDEVAKNTDIKVFHADSCDDATDILLQNAKEGSYVLVKGSRGMHMDEIVKEAQKRCMPM